MSSTELGSPSPPNPMHRPPADFHRWRQCRASTHVRTASRDGRKQRMCRRASSGRALRRSPAAIDGTAAAAAAAAVRAFLRCLVRGAIEPVRPL
uniref:Uncharacterized protein n=1 Tax=Arundo donax TaxID=35708 RepID=A0A0A9ACZ4_ARUDO